MNQETDTLIIDLTDPELYTEVFWKIQATTKRFVVNYGGAGCFTGNQMIVTNKGNKQISNIEKGDMVLTYNHKKDINEFKPVIERIKQKKHYPKLISIKMNNGTIINVTENHEFYYGGSYIKIKDLLVSLANDKMEKNTKF